MSAWTPINDYPGDQRYDDILGTSQASYWAEIGPDGASKWSWTIIGTDDYGNQWEVAGGIVSNELAAKTAVEEWRA